MQEKELIISLNELNRAEIKCQTTDCSGSITLSLAAKDEPGTTCPVCRVPLMDNRTNIFSAWRIFCDKATAAKAEIRFRVKQP